MAMRIATTTWQHSAMWTTAIAALRGAPRARAYALRSSQRAFTTVGSLRHNFADTKIGIGYLQLTPEEIEAEQELLQVLPEFQQAINVLHSDDDEFKTLPNTTKAARAIPSLERTVDICRSAMGFKSVYLAAALRHLLLTHFLQGNYAMANKYMQERGELMDWPITEQERILRLFLRQNQPQYGFEWCQKEIFTRLFPQDETMPMKWSIYELIGQSLHTGTKGLHVKDPLFRRSVEILRRKKDVIVQEHGKADDTLLSREIPYLLSQYAALCLVSSDSLAVNDVNELSDDQQVCLNQAEVLWKEALTWVERTNAEDNKDELTTGVDAPFEAWIQTNLGDLLLRKQKPEEAMEYLGKALQTQQNEKGGNALALSRVLGKIAQGCHVMGQAVSSEGLFTTVLESYEKEAFLSLTDQVEYAKVLRACGDLLAKWEKREAGAQQKYAQADELEATIKQRCQELKCQLPLDPVFYLPL